MITFKDLKIGQHLWVLCDDALIVVAKFNEYEYYVCGDWEMGINPYECEIVELIEKPKKYIDKKIYYNPKDYNLKLI